MKLPRMFHRWIWCFYETASTPENILKNYIFVATVESLAFYNPQKVIYKDFRKKLFIYKDFLNLIEKMGKFSGKNIS